MYRNKENRGKFQNFWWMTKKGHQKFWRMKIEKFLGKKEKFGKFSTESENFSKIGGNLKQGGKMHHGLRRGWTPLCISQPTSNYQNARYLRSRYLIPNHSKAPYSIPLYPKPR